MKNATPIHETEGFENRKAMDDWFRPLVKPGQTVEKTMMRFSLLNVPRQPSRSDDQIPEKSQPASGAVEPNPKSKRVGIGWTRLFAFIYYFFCHDSFKCGTSKKEDIIINSFCSLGGVFRIEARSPNMQLKIIRKKSIFKIFLQPKNVASFCLEMFFVGFSPLFNSKANPTFS